MKLFNEKTVYKKISIRRLFMHSVGQPPLQYKQTDNQQQLLNTYAKTKPLTHHLMPHKKVETTTVLGNTLTLKIPRGYLFDGSDLRTGASNEINSISIGERKAKLTTVADAYLVAGKSTYRAFAIAAVTAAATAATAAGIITSTIFLPYGYPILAGLSLLMPGVICEIERTVNAKQTRELMESILAENDINPSDTLDKINFRQMDLQTENAPELTPMRNRSLNFLTLPINTENTRTHLQHVFARNNDQLTKLNSILSDSSNFHHCPIDNDTEGGSFHERGWRNILGLCIEPDLQPENDEMPSETEPFLSTSRPEENPEHTKVIYNIQNELVKAQVHHPFNELSPN
ncbi:hypothetical protein [Endozoicomonas sp.]|uniref:hypothetical protein n=1 Tax=Endozoicomonas sp. TaxID=1892382 RepID=UPI0028885821|nr:hypothetical protein [Endozoicomonas sp.]